MSSNGVFGTDSIAKAHWKREHFKRNFLFCLEAWLDLDEGRRGSAVTRELKCALHCQQVTVIHFILNKLLIIILPEQNIFARSFQGNKDAYLILCDFFLTFSFFC